MVYKVYKVYEVYKVYKAYKIYKVYMTPLIRHTYIETRQALSPLTQLPDYISWSPKPMEVSPLGLRSVTVLPRALLEVSPDPLWGDDDNNNSPACINSPL